MRQPKLIGKVVLGNSRSAARVFTHAATYYWELSYTLASGASHTEELEVVSFADADFMSVNLKVNLALQVALGDDDYQNIVVFNLRRTLRS